ncbi:MAG: DNA methyltransferase [Chloroflexi bacterium]|nr:DNA methyltransferase [Chloroflexota bacterium]
MTFLTNADMPTGSGDWTFNGASTRALTHCYHDYPARMIPQVAGKLLDMFARDAGLLFDPYCGTGTSLVEGLVRGTNVVGTDLNPLARLIARAKTSMPGVQALDKQISLFNRYATRLHASGHLTPSVIRGISRLDFWFKPIVVERLSQIKAFIQDIEDECVRMFFQVAFSETVRESSNTRNEEFKLYRYSAEKLEGFNPNVFGIMAAKLKRNQKGLHSFLSIMQNFKLPPSSCIYDFNTVQGVPADKLAEASVDIVLTSPPYGDSHTTVAYGQYSRLSAAWLDLEGADKIDSRLMGGTIAKKMASFPSETLNQALGQISAANHKRALEVAAFYSDLYRSISHVSPLIKPDGYACYVVGNRKVKGVVLPTDVAVRNFFESYGFEYVDTFHRAIPNKRMPLRNSPTNAAGVLDATMTQEHIVVMRRKPLKTIGESRRRAPARATRRSRKRLAATAS